jgi:hypothetical protein
MTKIKLVSLIIVFLAGILLNFGLAGSAQAALTCSVSTACGTGETAVFKMSDRSNAHAETSGSYPYFVCCSGATGMGTSCSNNFAYVLRVSGTTNAHVEKSDQTTAGYSNVCLSASSGPVITCSYSSGSCPADSTCLASISSTTNAHVGDCVTSPYTTRVCCSMANTIVVTTNDASLVTGTSARLNGTLTYNGGENCTVSFDWGDTISYGSTTTVSGLKTTGESFSSDIGISTKGKLYHFRAKAQNSTLNATGSDKTFFVLPDAPTSSVANAVSYNRIDLSWTKGAGAVSTIIRRGVGSCPASTTDGSQACGGAITGTSCNDTVGLVENTSYCYRAWSLASDEGREEYSLGYSQVSATTLTKVDVTTLSASSIVGTSAILNGRLDNDGGQPCNLWFKWGDNLPYTASTTYSANQRSVVSFGYLFPTGSLTKGKAYHFQAAASNAGDSDLGNDSTFITLPDAPTGLTANAISYGQIDLSWTKGTGATSTIIRRGVGSCPATTTDGSPACGGAITGTSCNDTAGLVESTNYCYRAWSLASEEGLNAYSIGFSEASASTPAAPAFNFTISLVPTSRSINQGSQATSVVTVVLTEGTTQPISFSTSSLPSGVTVSFSPASCSPNTSCTSIMTIYTTVSTPLGTHSINVYGNGGGKERSASLSLTVKIAGATINPPTVVTNLATSIAETSADLNGSLTDMGGASSVLVWFEWGTSTSYGHTTSPVSMAATGTIPSARITGLTSGVTYYFKAMAKNGVSW